MLAFALALTLAALPGIPSNYVPTPAGAYIHPSCVQIVPSGTLAPPPPPCPYQVFTTQQVRALAAQVGGQALAGQPASLNGWLANSDAANWAPGQRPAYIHAQWRVPRVPPLGPGQIIFIFPGIQTSVVALDPAIVQPVTACDMYGCRITSVKCNDGTNCPQSAPIWVSPGDLIDGVSRGVECNATTGICNTWIITTTDLNNGGATTLRTSFSGVMVHAVGMALEVYGLAGCSQLPAQRFVLSFNIAVGGFPSFYIPTAPGGQQIGEPIYTYPDITPPMAGWDTGAIPSCGLYARMFNNGSPNNLTTYIGW